MGVIMDDVEKRLEQLKEILNASFANTLPEVSEMLDVIAYFHKLTKQQTDALEMIYLELNSLRAQSERLAWNLGGCASYALGYSLDESIDQEKALPALLDVRNLALANRELRAEYAELKKAVIEVLDCYDSLDTEFRAGELETLREFLNRESLVK